MLITSIVGMDARSTMDFDAIDIRIAVAYNEFNIVVNTIDVDIVVGVANENYNKDKRPVCARTNNTAGAYAKRQKPESSG